MKAPGHSLPLLLLLLAIGLSSHAWADGGFVQRRGHNIWEPEQSAIIVFDERAGLQDMVLLVKFQGDAKDFGWIVPLPSLPEIQEADIQLFREANRLTQPIYQRRGGGLRCWLGEDRALSSSAAGGRGSGLGYDDGVDIYNEQTVGIYRAITVGADDAGALTDSLAAWGYLHQDNEEIVVPTLDYYIQKGWYFVAMKIDSPDSLDMSWTGTWLGLTDPVRFTFPADQIVYPLKISSISVPEEADLLLYVVTDHKVIFAGGTVQYANDVSWEEYEQLRQEYPTFSQLVLGPCYITKLWKTLTRHDMTDDLKVTRAPDDLEYREVIYYTEIPASDGLLVAMAAVLLFRSRRKRRPMVPRPGNNRR